MSTAITVSAMRDCQSSITPYFAQHQVSVNKNACQDSGKGSTDSGAAATQEHIYVWHIQKAMVLFVLQTSEPSPRAV